MNENLLPYLPILLGILSVGYGLHAIGAGKNTVHNVELARAEKPRTFWVVTGIEIAIGLGLVWLGIQMLALV